MALTTLERAALHVRLDSPDEESLAELQDLVDAAEEHVATYLGRPLTPWTATQEQPPKAVMHAVLLHLTDLYENRSANVEKTLSANPTVDRLLHFHRIGLGV